MTTKEAPEVPERVTLTEPRSPADVFREPPGMVSQAKYDAKEAERAALEAKLAEVTGALDDVKSTLLAKSMASARAELLEWPAKLAEVTAERDAWQARICETLGLVDYAEGHGAKYGSIDEAVIAVREVMLQRDRMRDALYFVARLTGIDFLAPPGVNSKRGSDV